MEPTFSGHDLDAAFTREAHPVTGHSGVPADALDITEADVLEALGPDADELLASADVDVAELIRLINAETVVLPPLVLPEFESDEDEAPQFAAAVSTWKRRFLKGAVAAVILSLTGGGGAAAAMDKSVTVEIDGETRQVNTFDSTVGEVLQDEGVTVGKHDAVSPSPQSEIQHGDTITLDQGRLLKMTVDGEPREEWVRSVTVGQALRQLGIPDQGAWTSADRSMAVPENGMNLAVKTQKNITITDGGGAPRELSTNAVTVDELVKEQNLALGAEDSISPGGGEKVVDGAAIQIDRLTSSVVNVTTPIEPPVKEIEDDSMLKGEEKVQEQGTPGEKIVFTRVSERNGEETGREIVGEKVVREASERVVLVGTKTPPVSSGGGAGGNTVWDKLAQCESTGNWSANSGNGYYGGLQFDQQTWSSFGGDQYAAYPHQASREQQIEIATKVRDSRGGYGAWPSCSSKLGLS
ncbi:DUF348 domain-containing protein [Allosaccharopolyspora coralli]|uniref:DUF348 domain-containing protein n=2 Tax=Allosaccharopolyspora coralli TaxID=2665642 RepID=A0A5Q3QDL1_9PSEU|nr:DUF348 domain-containing protein [Allosaccharopolyspora coralli]